MRKSEELGMSEAEKEIEINETLSEIKQLLIKQTEKGLVKYGHSVNPNELSVEQWLTHMQEEMLDGLIYATIAKKKLIELEVKVKAEEGMSE